MTFTAAAAADNPVPTVQWQVSTTGTAGTFHNIGDNATTTTGTLTLTNITPAQSGYAYRAVFTNNAGSTTTMAATLTVCLPPAIIIPANITVNATSRDGAVVSYDVTASDSIDGQLTPVCTPPSGSTFPIGTTTVNCSATNSGSLISTSSFTVTVSRTFASFQDQFGLLNADPTSDPNHTGVCQLSAYAFGVNPTAPDRSQLPTAILQNGFLQISYSRWKDASDVTYVVEVSGDLQNWYSGPGNTQEVSIKPVNGDPTREQVITRDVVPTTNSPRRFIRVRITH